MNDPIQRTNTIPSVRNSIGRPSPRRCLFLSALACFALSPQARAVCQQGCDIPNNNTFLGDGALLNNTIGTQNTATGENTLPANTTGSLNTATGAVALNNNTTGAQNTATGGAALLSNTTGSNNTATGETALFLNTTGYFNVADGVGALGSNTSGFNNTANGGQALSHNTTGSKNIALGAQAGSALTTGNNNIDIGNAGVAGEAGIIRVGVSPNQTRAFIAGISGVVVGGGVGVVINASGKLGTVNSSKRFKDEIKPMDKASEAILSLRPVTFHYKPELDPEGIPQFGLVAEDVEKVNPDLVARDNEGKVYTVRYEAVNAMLLNEFLKEHRKVEELELAFAQQQREFKAKLAEQENLKEHRKVAEQGAVITELKSAVAQQQKQITALVANLKEQASQIQKASAQLKLRKSAPQLVDNNP